MIPVTRGTVRAQAKLNLFLRILARESGGYHQVETLLCRVDLADLVDVRVTGGDRSLHCEGPGVPPGGLGACEDNLAWRAAEAFGRVTGFPRGFDIRIHKAIPVGAGLGGGSADAGGVLRILNALSPEPLPVDSLLAIAGDLGADVPFLTQAESTLALAWGRGDRLALLPPLPAREVQIFLPSVGVSTADAYRWLDLEAPSHGAVACPTASLSTWSGVARLAGNDFERPVSRRVGEVADLLAAVRGAADVGEIVQMSGSGSAVFRIRADGRGILRQVASAGGVDIRQARTAVFVEPVSVND